MDGKKSVGVTYDDSPLCAAESLDSRQKNTRKELILITGHIWGLVIGLGTPHLSAYYCDPPSRNQNFNPSPYASWRQVVRNWPEILKSSLGYDAIVVYN